jgi:hypothetical protein
MKTLSVKLALVGLVGMIAAVPAASQADSFRLSIGSGRFGIHIGRERRPAPVVVYRRDYCPPPVVVVDEHDWRWRRDHERVHDFDHGRGRRR